MVIDIDDNLIQTATTISNTRLQAKDLIEEIILAFIQREAGKRLADLGGKAPAMKCVVR